MCIEALFAHTAHRQRVETARSSIVEQVLLLHSRPATILLLLTGPRGLMFWARERAGGRRSRNAEIMGTPMFRGILKGRRRVITRSVHSWVTQFFVYENVASRYQATKTVVPGIRPDPISINGHIYRTPPSDTCARACTWRRVVSPPMGTVQAGLPSRQNTCGAASRSLQGEDAAPQSVTPSWDEVYPLEWDHECRERTAATWAGSA